MTLRVRLAVFIAVTVGVAVALVAVVAYGFAASEARTEIDDFLRGRGPGVGLVGAFDLDDYQRPVRRGSGPLGGVLGPLDDIVREDAVAQFFDPSGAAVTIGFPGVVLPIDDRDREIAAQGGPDYFRDVTIDGVHYRMLTRPLASGLGVQVARDVTATDELLSDLRARLLLLGAAGVLLAALTGWIVARRSLRPVGLLTDAAEHVASTRDLEAHIPVERHDELGRLAEAFNGMLEALEEARTSQQRLVTDASHELRTPLTSLRTNIELLARDAVDGADRAELLADLTSEAEELSHLVAEVVDLATIGRDEEPFADVDLNDLVAEAAQRAERRYGVSVEVTSEPTVVSGRSAALLRAINNLLENAVKWGGEGGRIDVSLEKGRLAVRDRGPGIPPDDLPHVFDRFYRAPAARATPGSGLGLSIMAAVVEDHGGTVFAVNDPTGGAVVGFEL